MRCMRNQKTRALGLLPLLLLLLLLLLLPDTVRLERVFEGLPCETRAAPLA